MPGDGINHGCNSLVIFLPFQFENSTLHDPEIRSVIPRDMDIEDTAFRQSHVA